MQNKPLISIIIPIYNSENYIRDTILSCTSQSYQNIEIILINDGSTDQTESVINQITDDRIQYFKVENSGACNARNFGISKSKGQLLQFLDHDDLLDSEKLLHQIKYYEENGDDYIYSCSMGSVSDEVKTVDEQFAPYQKNFSPLDYFKLKLSIFAEDITTGAWLTPSKLIHSTYGWDSNSGLNDDGEYFMRVILNSKGIISCKESIFYFRRDVPGSLSKQFDSKEVYIKWLFSYQSYVKHFLQRFEGSIGRRLSWMALSVYYCNSYPHYPDLLKQCKAEMNNLGYKQPFPIGGKIFTIVANVMGVDNTLFLWNYKNKINKLLRKT